MIACADLRLLELRGLFAEVENVLLPVLSLVVAHLHDYFEDALPWPVRVV